MENYHDGIDIGNDLGSIDFYILSQILDCLLALFHITYSDHASCLNNLAGYKQLLGILRIICWLLLWFWRSCFIIFGR
ncbi:hypothetical protein RchiOBHm_Chr7g0213101 [Rosa chinensis]|uniref:Uncharacterized protein n=1 Tax=Rosa chinensis TaxID=74649 RepID=A0A2P6PAW2_ROSCH|nr:hypothetical protein RchiOBHm_Chr7g0213101 [Rosa chinensis]